MIQFQYFMQRRRKIFTLSFGILKSNRKSKCGKASTSSRVALYLWTFELGLSSLGLTDCQTKPYFSRRIPGRTSALRVRCETRGGPNSASQLDPFFRMGLSYEPWCAIKRNRTSTFINKAQAISPWKELGTPWKYANVTMSG
jgi:hypothetical protein